MRIPLLSCLLPVNLVCRISDTSLILSPLEMKSHILGTAVAVSASGEVAALKHRSGCVRQFRQLEQLGCRVEGTATLPNDNQR